MLPPKRNKSCNKVQTWEAIVISALMVLFGAGSLVYQIQNRGRDRSSQGTEEALLPTAGLSAGLNTGLDAQGESLVQPESAEGGDIPGTDTTVRRLPDAGVTSPTGDAQYQAGASSPEWPRFAAGTTQASARSISTGSDTPGVQDGPFEPRRDRGDKDTILQYQGNSTIGTGSDGQSLPGQPGTPVVVPFDPSAPAESAENESRYSADARVQVPEGGTISGETGTISFVLDPQWSSDNQRDVSLVEIGDGQLVIKKNVSYLRLEMTDITGAETGTGFSIGDWTPGKPHHVTATWGGGVMALYVDGKPAAQQRYANPFSLPFGTPLYIGNAAQQAPVAPGLLTKVVLSDAPLSPGEVSNLAGMTLPKPN